MNTPAIDYPPIVRATTTERVTFRDGMVVTAEDLEAAMRYPASMLHTVLRSYFGCGVVCGLELKSEIGTEKEPRWSLCIDAGVAFDCAGYPLELCRPVSVDLNPGHCAPDIPSDGLEVCIAIRRATHDESSGNACSCGSSSPERHCSRSLDHIMIKAVLKSNLADLEPGLCKRLLTAGDVTDGKKGDQTAKEDPPQPALDGGQARPDQLQSCLTTCSDCTCTDPSWVLLGCVTIKSKLGIIKTSHDERKFVKPIECLIWDRLSALEAKVDEYRTGPAK